MNNFDHLKNKTANTKFIFSMFQSLQSNYYIADKNIFVFHENSK